TTRILETTGTGRAIPMPPGRRATLPSAMTTAASEPRCRRRRRPSTAPISARPSRSPTTSPARVTLRVDDGAAVWLNSEVVAKYNVGNLAHDRYASSSINASDVTIELPVEAFQVGTNILGVMLKQAGKTSPDLYFDLELEVDLLP